jgi:putative membrane protein
LAPQRRAPIMLFIFYMEILMKRAILTGAFIFVAANAWADSPDSSFMKNAAEGGMSEIEMGQLAQEKASSPAVKSFGAMMIKDHSAANEKLKKLAASKQVNLPDSPSLMQKASKTKLDMMSGDSFDKSYIKGMIDDHKMDIKDFQKEASDGKDPEAKAFAAATLPTLEAHLKKIQSIAMAAGIKE